MAKTGTKTPVHALQKALAARSAAAKKADVVYTTEEVKGFGWQHPIYKASQRGGDAEVRAYLASQKAAA